MSIPNPYAFTYKTADSLPIDLDIYLPPLATRVPILIWFHGGGLLQGTRKTISPHHLRGITKHNYAFITADYRLCPQVHVRDVLDDVKDCLSFVKHKLPSLLPEGADAIDTSRIAVSGSSAGGYLALLAGLYATDPAPKVMLPIYPITDPLGKFFTTPQSNPQGTGPIAQATLAPYLDPKAPAVAYNEPEDPRQKFYVYMMQEAIEAELLGIKEGEEEFIVAPQIRKRGVGMPCYVVHGDKDRYVGVEQSDEVVEALREKGATVVYDRPEGLDHLFDRDEACELEGYYEFMKKYL